MLRLTAPRLPGLNTAAGEGQKIQNGQMQPIVGGVKNRVREEALGFKLGVAAILALLLAVWLGRE